MTALTFRLRIRDQHLLGTPSAFTKEVHVVKTIAVNLPNKGEPMTHCAQLGEDPRGPKCSVWVQSGNPPLLAVKGEWREKWKRPVVWVQVPTPFQ